jgi:hypothetical protein
VPDPIDGLGYDPELDDELAGKVSRLDVAAAFPATGGARGSSSPMMIRA